LIGDHALRAVKSVTDLTSGFLSRTTGPRRAYGERASGIDSREYSGGVPQSAL
jgi:hypothetical protein